LNTDVLAVGNFYAANILNLVAAFNSKESIFDRLGVYFSNPDMRGKIAVGERFVLSNEALEDFHIAVDFSAPGKRSFLVSTFGTSGSKIISMGSGNVAVYFSIRCQPSYYLRNIRRIYSDNPIRWSRN